MNSTKELRQEKLTLKDFTLQEIKTEALDRVSQFQKWIKQSKNNDHQVYWNESTSGISPVMKLVDPKTRQEQEVISFISNDYLGMSQREEVKEAGIEAVRKYGAGACAAPIIGGYLDIHKELEEKIAMFTGNEDALIFSSGFGVNVGILNSLLGKDDLALVDFSAHTSALDGLRGANVKRVSHNNVDYLDFVLKREKDNYKTKLVVVDGVYSHDGDIANLPEIIKVCKQHDALLYVDDAHGMGVFGKTGRGIAEHYDVLGEVDIITGTFSKSFGSVGGFVSCSQQMADYFRYYANTTVFSASITPQSTASVLKSIELLQENPSIREKLWENVVYLKNRLLNENFDIKETVSPIFPIMVRDPFKAKEITQLLKEEGVYAIAIVYPAVSSKESRIRIGLTAIHDFTHLDHLVDALINVRKKVPF